MVSASRLHRKVTRLFILGTLLASPPAIGQTRPADAAESRIRSVIAHIDAHQRKGMMNVPAADGQLLRTLAEASGARHIVEIGTSNGYSGLWFCLALQKTGGRLTTFEIDAHRAALARENFRRAGVASQITLIEGDAHEEVPKLTGPIDMVFLDADKSGYLDYLNKLLPKLRPGSVILAHNTTNMARDMQNYIDAVTNDPRLETVFLHPTNQGIGVSIRKTTASKTDRPTPPAGARLGYINHIPPETALEGAIRHQRIADRRRGEVIIVHRGHWLVAPENTLEAYAAAMDAGAQGVEIDIRRTANGVLYLFHDDTLERMTSGSGKVSGKTYYELISLDLAGTRDHKTKIPTLAAFLTLARQRAMLLHLDVKEADLQREIIAMLDEADMWDHVVHVNARHADQIRNDKRLHLRSYRGWWPKGPDTDHQAMIDALMSHAGDMVFCDDPRGAVRFLNKAAHKPVPVPESLKAYWTERGEIR